jgi:hypothetical protein
MRNALKKETRKGPKCSALMPFHRPTANLISTARCARLTYFKLKPYTKTPINNRENPKA